MIDTERLILRRFNENDAGGLVGILGDPDVMRFSLSGPYSSAQIQKFLERSIVSYESDGLGLWAVIHKEDRYLIGCCGYLVQQVDGQREIELTYRFAKAYWGQGFATEAAGATCKYGFETLRLNRLISIIEAENTASIRVAEKCGMTCEKESVFHGIDVKIYAMDNKVNKLSCPT